MSVDKILSNEYEVILLDKEGFTQPQTGEFKQVLRLARIGAEAEREVKKCGYFADPICYIVCENRKVCKMVREVKHERG